VSSVAQVLKPFPVGEEATLACNLLYYNVKKLCRCLFPRGETLDVNARVLKIQDYALFCYDSDN